MAQYGYRIVNKFSNIGVNSGKTNMKHKLLEKGHKYRIKNVSPRWVRIMRILGLCVVVIAIIHLGVQTVWYLRTGNYYGHTNFWNQPVGTLLLVLCL